MLLIKLLLFFQEKNSEQAKEIWLVEPASVVIEKYREAVKKLEVFMTEQNLVNEPQEVYNLKGDAARIAFVKNFKEIQKLKNTAQSIH